MSMKTFAAAAALTAFAGIAMPGGAASATTEATTHFDIIYGNTYFVGDITWYNRSVEVDGTLHGISCRTVVATTYTTDLSRPPLDERSTSPVCNASVVEHIPLNADVYGGAAYVVMNLDDPYGGLFNVLKSAVCTRTSCKYY